MYSAWQKLADKNPQLGFSPEGVDYAYRLAREFHDSAATKASAEEVPETVQAPNKVAAARGANGRFKKAETAAAESASVGGAGFDPTTEPVSQDEGMAMMERMAAVRTVKPGNEDLGFFE
jgi:hypothetical protein